MDSLTSNLALLVRDFLINGGINFATDEVFAEFWALLRAA